MLRLNLKAVCLLRGIQKPYAWLLKAGFPPSAAFRLNGEDYSNLPLAHLEKLCLLLRCTPHDLLRWTPDADTVEADSQPLAALHRKEENDLHWISNMNAKSVDELREIGRKLSQMEGGNDLPKP